MVEEGGEPLHPPPSCLLSSGYHRSGLLLTTLNKDLTLRVFVAVIGFPQKCLPLFTCGSKRDVWFHPLPRLGSYKPSVKLVQK